LDVVDFNKSCEEARNKFLPISGIPIYYAICENCGFCFTPEIYQWEISDFASKIYNEGYIEVDPDYVDVRPRSNAKILSDLFEHQKKIIRHLDYGGGSGLLSQLLREKQWQSVSYDPFYNKDQQIEDLGKFDLITAYEVFEHVPSVEKLMLELSSLLVDNGLILFSTLLSDGQIKKNQRIQWWYAAPRNGHISLFSQASLSILANRAGFSLGSFSTGFHAMWRTVPTWANHIINTH
jgi:SAM-dependent methyltransferase